MKTVLVSLMAQKAEVKYDSAYILPSQIMNKVTEMGFQASLLESETAGQATVELRVCVILFAVLQNAIHVLLNQNQN